MSRSLTVTNRSQHHLAVAGRTLAPQTNRPVPLAEVLGNPTRGRELSALVAAGKITVSLNGEILTAAEIEGIDAPLSADIAVRTEELIRGVDMTDGAVMQKLRPQVYRSIKHNFEATHDPDEGWEASASSRDYGWGSLWYNILNRRLFVRGRNAWVPIDTIKHLHDGRRPPTPRDDSGHGFDHGSRWCDVTTREAWICLDPATGGAVWKRITTRDFDTFRFQVEGAVSTGTKISGSWIAPFPGSIRSVSVVRDSTAGTGGSTIVDVNINGTTVFTDQNNRPEIAYDDATGIVHVVPPAIAVTGFAKHARITMDVDAIDTGGSPSDLDVIVGVEYGSEF